MTHIESPKISVISFCLNFDRFLRDTIESVLQQTYDNYEHIIVDGGSTDNTTEILKEYSHLRWISEKEVTDAPILEAVWKGLNMARGEYIITLAVSDGIYDKDWFKNAVEVLDTDHQVSMVWGLSRVVSEDGRLGGVFFSEFLESDPPQKMDFFPYWLSSGHGFESNAVYRRNVLDICFTKNNPDDPYRNLWMPRTIYQLHTQGYLSYFLPIISYFGRTHKNQRQEVLTDSINSLYQQYLNDVKLYKKRFFSGAIRHYFRDGSSEIIKEVAPNDLGSYRRKIWRYYIKSKINRNVKKLQEHI